MNLRNYLTCDTNIFADVENWRTKKSTINDTPEYRVPLCIQHHRGEHPSLAIHVMELAVPSKIVLALSEVRSKKQNKTDYNFLLNDLKDRGWSTLYDTIEIGSF